MTVSWQTHQERIYQEYVASKAKEKGSQLEEYYEQVLTRTQTELTCILTVHVHIHLILHFSVASRRPQKWLCISSLIMTKAGFAVCDFVA